MESVNTKVNKFKVGDKVYQITPPDRSNWEFNVEGVHQVESVGQFAVRLLGKSYSYDHERFALIETEPVVPVAPKEKSEYYVAVCETTYQGYEMFKRIGNYTKYACYNDAEEAALKKLEDVGDTTLTLAVLKVCSRIVKEAPKPSYTVKVIH